MRRRVLLFSLHKLLIRGEKDRRSFGLWCAACMHVRWSKEDKDNWYIWLEVKLLSFWSNLHVDPSITTVCVEFCFPCSVLFDRAKAFALERNCQTKVNANWTGLSICCFSLSALGHFYDLWDDRLLYKRFRFYASAQNVFNTQWNFLRYEDVDQNYWKRQL